MARRKAATVNLDDLFHANSSARKIAERLMTGKPQTRYQLVEGLGTSVTTVNRVVAQLEKAGVIVTREIGSNGRQAVFRMVEVAAPKVERPYLHIGDQVRVVAARISGDDMLIDTTVDKYTYRGVLRGVVTNVNMGAYATVQAVERVDDTLSNVRFEAHGAASGERVVVLESVRNVTGA
jgi:predicted ArsR family transcriptional regulator